MWGGAHPLFVNCRCGNSNKGMDPLLCTISFPCMEVRREREREREGQDEMREEMERRRFWFYLCATFDIGLYMYWLYKSMEYI